MHLYKLNRTFPRLKNVIVRSQSHAALLEQNEYTETPEYPPIVDTSPQGKHLRKRESIREKVQNINTVEEKQIALNIPRYYGWKCVMLHDNKVPYNAIPLVQHYTRSHFINIDKLPDAYSETLSTADTTVKEIKSQIEDALLIENDRMNFKFDSSEPRDVDEQENAAAECIVRQINRIISNNLADKVSYMLSAQVDYKPRHEAFWFVGGVDAPPTTIYWRHKNPYLHKNVFEPIQLPVQYLGSPLLTIRSNLPLKPIIPYSEAENPDFKVPKFNYLPCKVGYFQEHRHGTNIPGFWPGEHDKHGLISFHGRGHILRRREAYSEEDNIEALHSQAMLASFGWLLAQANNLGFTTYNDLTFPLTTQTVITNGQLWSMYGYQLNTIVFHKDATDSNMKHNICFGTKPLKLYESIEDGKVNGLNEDVLKMLLQFYLNTPEERDYELTPYLGKDEKYVADIEDDNRRCWLENTYKHIVANRPKHYLLPEVYLWEKIYKIKHNTRFFEPKRRPFERGVNPYHRRLDEHLPPYIPKVLRPYPKSKKKFETTYYPNV